MSDLLNQLLQDFVYEDELGEIDISFIRSLQKLITRQKVSLQPQTYKTKMGLDKTQEYAHQFLRKLDKRYDDYFTLLLDTGVIHIHSRMKREHRLSMVTFPSTGRRVDIYATKTLEDAYTFVHEVMHSWNSDEANFTVTWHFMTECFSILAENLQCDSMLGLHPEYKKNKRDTYYALRERAIMLGFELDLVDFYMSHGYIDDEMMLRYIETKSREERCTISNHLDWIEENQMLKFDFLQRDVIGGVMASYMHNRILDNPKRIGEFIELNDHCNEIPFLDLIRYLDLEVKDLDTWELEEESLHKLEHSYQKELKSL